MNKLDWFRRDQEIKNKKQIKTWNRTQKTKWKTVLTRLVSYIQFSSVQLLSHVWLFVTPWIAARQASLSITNCWSSLISIESVMPSSHLILCRPFSSFPQSLPASESFPKSQLFTWSGQSTGVSASASFPPKKY